MKRIPRKVKPALEQLARYRAASNLVYDLSQALQEPITLEATAFHRHYENTLALPMPVVYNLSPRQLARFEEFPTVAIGVDLEILPNRSYPWSSTAAHILGYLTRDTRSTIGEDAFVNYRLPDYSGSVGIEGAFDRHLRGRGGVKSVLVNSLGYRQSENTWTPAEPGKNVVLTIDLEIQRTAEEALLSVGTDPKGAVVVLDPQNGDILAMVSLPSFDPNKFIPRISQPDYNMLMDENRRPLVNRATQENYHPGSIFKIVTGLACLEAGLNPKQVIYNPGYIFVGRRSWNDLAPAGEYDFRRAFAKSSNTYFITNGITYGPDKIVRLGQKLHLGEATGIPTSQEVGGNFPSLQEVKRQWYDGDTANLSIGQGKVDMTPLQVAVLVAAVANGGKVFQPRLVMRIEPQDPDSTEETIQFPGGKVRDDLGVRPSNLEIVRQAMLADVEDPEGTGKGAAVPGFRVAGKTGTAEVKRIHEGAVVKDQTTWFASFGPFEQPRYVVVVMVEGGVWGGTTCAPVARKIYEFLAARMPVASPKTQVLAGMNTTDVHLESQ